MHLLDGLLDLLGGDLHGREGGGGVLRIELADAFAQEVVGEGEVAAEPGLHPALQLDRPVVGVLRLGIPVQLAEQIGAVDHGARVIRVQELGGFEIADRLFGGGSGFRPRARGRGFLEHKRPVLIECGLWPQRDGFREGPDAGLVRRRRHFAQIARPQDSGDPGALPSRRKEEGRAGECRQGKQDLRSDALGSRGRSGWRAGELSEADS